MNSAPLAPLNAAEAYLWQLGAAWRDAPPPPPGLDWDRLVAVALDNRMPVLLDQVLRAGGLRADLSPAAEAALARGVAKYRRQAALLGRALADYLGHAAALGQDVVVIKGLWLSIKIYGEAALRPGSDIDVLLHERDIPAALRILEEEMGYGRWWRPLLADAYYARHHLHQQRANHNRVIWFEPHWLLDHPYSRLTIDYDGLLARTTPGLLLGQPVREMAPPDLLISLAVHLVKHAVYLPATLWRPDLQRLILADGMLMYFVDVAEAVRHYEGQIDWLQTVALARASGTAVILGSVLSVCRRFLGAPIPAPVLEELGCAAPPSPQPSLIMRRLADQLVATYLGQEPDRLWRFLLGYQASVVFRPIRLLDLLAYLLPGADYLRRRYGRAGAGTAVWHLLRAGGQYARVGADTVTFTLRRKAEVRRLDRQGYEWPELPPEPEP